LIKNVTDLPPETLGFRASGKITSEEYRQMMEPPRPEPNPPRPCQLSFAHQLVRNTAAVLEMTGLEMLPRSA
jgi:hypothetical protein